MQIKLIVKQLSQQENMEELQSESKREPCRIEPDPTLATPIDKRDSRQTPTFTRVMWKTTLN